MPDISFFMKDREGRFIALNRMGCEFCGVTTEREAFGRTDRDFFPEVNAELYMADDRAVMDFLSMLLKNTIIRTGQRSRIGQVCGPNQLDC